MAYFGTRFIPPFSAVMDVARETIRSLTPDENRCLEYARKLTRLVQNNRRAPDENDTEMGETDRFARSPTNADRSAYSQIQSPPDYGGIDNEAIESSSQHSGSSPKRTRRMVHQFSFATGSFDHGDVELGAPYKIDEWQAAWNVTNAIQGMFIVSLPYAVLKGGYWAIIAMLGIAYICCETGKKLVDCLYEIDPKTGAKLRIRDSYVAIAKDVLGPIWGPLTVNTAQLIELLMTCILYIVVSGDLLSGTFDGHERTYMIVTGVILLPLAFLKSIHHVSTLSFYCTMAHLIINAILLGYCMLRISEWDFSQIRLSLDFIDFPISLGVIVFSYTSQIFLPTLEGNMRDRSKFNKMLDWSHIAAAIFKVLFGLILFLTFQMDTQQVITNNLESVTFRGIVNLCLFIKALLSYPLPYYAAVEIMEKNIEPYVGKPTDVNGELKYWSLAFRLAVIAFTACMAITIPHFAILMGFIGSLTGTMLSFILPAWFHLYLKGDELRLRTIIFDWVIIFLGVLFCVIGVLDSGKALISAYQIGLPLPFNAHRRFKIIQNFSGNTTATTMGY